MNRSQRITRKTPEAEQPSWIFFSSSEVVVWFPPPPPHKDFKGSEF